ncbi:MAG: hybrid sensor histidine kinase/response regulator [Xanthobacteraceae bacterium]|nr:hybrid sensor histidine kinase/response regulator [Xanthobacteraceae bacterium]
MEDLLREFLIETNESLDVVDNELVRFEQEPNNADVLGRIFRLVHTIKGTCGFIGLPRLEALAHAAETVMGKFRDGAPVTAEAVSLVLVTIDRLKAILAELEATSAEPAGSDGDLIVQLEQMALDGGAPAQPKEEITIGTLSPQVLERPLRPGEVSLDDLERAFRDTPGPQEKKADKRESERRTGERRHPDTMPNGAQTLRVSVDTVERLMTMVSELVLTRNQLLEIVRRHSESEFKVPLQRLSNVTAELQEGVMKTRMQPIGNAWAKLPRIVRDLGHELGKDIELEMHGAETELDRQVLDIIRDPLTHMVRNSADHGLERPEERIKAGKSAKGTIRLSAYQASGQIVIEIADDGRGLNLSKIRSRAIEAGLIEEGDQPSEAQLHKMIFAPGFSTAEKVTSVSGRGVGMDVVKTNIDQIGGTVDLRSTPGRGSTFSIKIPLTLAIVPALIVRSGGERYAIPQVAVVELVHRGSNASLVEEINGALVLRLRDKLLPLLSLSQLLKLPKRDVAESEAFVVVMQVGASLFGIVVDDVLHTEEIVVKPVAASLRDIKVLGGNTILGDGSVIMILDPNGIADSIGATREERTIDDFSAKEVALDDDALRSVSMLVFRSGTGSLKAVPLSLVTRLEEIDAKKIELSSGRPMVQYRGGLMPLVPADANVKLAQDGTQPLLVFTDGGRSVGLIVDEIVDIVEDRLEIKVASETPGVLGSAIIREQATEVIDVAYFLPLGFNDWFHGKGAAREKKKLLFVDDSAFFRNMLAPVLQAAGYDVTPLPGAKEALALIERGARFDLVVTDIEMPEMDGYAFGEALQANARTAHLPVVALSSSLSGAAVAKSERAGMHAYVAKFDRRGLLQALKTASADLQEAA